MKSLYWVFTLKCNDSCDHCYNNSSPTGESIEIDDLLQIVPNLPYEIGRIILSGGEPLVEWKKLKALLNALTEKYQNRVPLFLQTNGDLLNQDKLDKLAEFGLERIDITSLDRYHKHQGKRANQLQTLLESKGWINLDKEPQFEMSRKLRFKMWGANEEIWLGGNWARGRALENQLALMNPKHNFCSLWSGAKDFLGGENQEVHIQLYRLYPCCPSTAYSLGDVRKYSVDSLLAQSSKIKAYQILNQGDIYHLGEDVGLQSSWIQNRIEELGDVCLWCDEYFTKYYTGSKGEIRANLNNKKP